MLIAALGVHTQTRDTRLTTILSVKKVAIPFVEPGLAVASRAPGRKREPATSVSEPNPIPSVNIVNITNHESVFPVIESETNCQPASLTDDHINDEELLKCIFCLKLDVLQQDIQTHYYQLI